MKKKQLLKVRPVCVSAQVCASSQVFHGNEGGGDEVVKHPTSKDGVKFGPFGAAAGK